VITPLLAAALLTASPAPFTFSAARASPRHPLLLLAPRPVERATLLVRFHAGAVDDGEQSGLTRYAQRSLLYASRRVPAATLARTLFAADAEVHITTALRHCDFELTAARGDFERLATMLLPMLLAPELDPARLAGAKEQTRHDQRELRGRDLADLVARVAVEEPGYLNRPHGTEGGLAGIEPAQLRAHLAGPLSPANATVVITGGFDPARLRPVVAGLAGGAAPPERTVDMVTPYSIQVPASSEIYLVAYRSRLGRAKSAAVGRLAGTLLEERIHRALREKGLGYSELAAPIQTGWLDLFMVLLPAHDPSDQPLGQYVDQLVGELRAGRFDDAELARERGFLLEQLAQTDRTPPALAHELADGRGGEWYGPAMVAQLRSLDRASLTAALPALLAEEASVRILYSPVATRRGPIPDRFLGRRP
jgi:predicted Zn-dependent peptidase